MPLIRVDSTITTARPTPKNREELLAKLKNEIEGQVTEGGPVIFEIPGECEHFDVLVVWEEWKEWESEIRTGLILDAYGDKNNVISQALGVTYEEAMQQQLLPYVVVSAFEQNPRIASLVCDRDEQPVEKLIKDIREAKRAKGGILLPNGKVELRFPTRAMAESTYEALFADKEYRYFYWSVVPSGTSAYE